MKTAAIDAHMHTHSIEHFRYCFLAGTVFRGVFFLMKSTSAKSAYEYGGFEIRKTLPHHCSLQDAVSITFVPFYSSFGLPLIFLSGLETSLPLSLVYTVLLNVPLFRTPVLLCAANELERKLCISCTIFLSFAWALHCGRLYMLKCINQSFENAVQIVKKAAQFHVNGHYGMEHLRERTLTLPEPMWICEAKEKERHVQPPPTNTNRWRRGMQPKEMQRIQRCNRNGNREKGRKTAHKVNKKEAKTFTMSTTKWS